MEVKYKNYKLSKFTKLHGIDHQFSAPYTPEQNRKSERYNRTIVESARSMLTAKSLPVPL